MSEAENVITLHVNDDDSYVIWGDGPAWPNDEANPREHGSVWPGYAAHRGSVALGDATGLAKRHGARIVIDGEVTL